MILLFVAALEVHGYADLYYAYNFNRPPDRNNFAPGVGTSAKRHDEPGWNLFALDVGLPAEPIGFRVILNAGSGAQVVHAGELWGRLAWTFIQQATVAGKAGPVLLEAGIMPAYLGGESLPSKDNWNYTRSWMAELSPYYFLGARARFTFDTHWSTQLLVLNGWQRISDNNDGKSLGWQLAYNSDVFSVILNGYAGPERSVGDPLWRFFADVVTTVRVTTWLSLQAVLDAGIDGAPWYGAALYARVQPLEWIALAGRGELYHDVSGVISGVAQTIADATLTLELRPTKYLLLRLEGRYDRSTAPIFSNRRHQPLLATGVTAHF